MSEVKQVPPSKSYEGHWDRAACLVSHVDVEPATGACQYGQWEHYKLYGHKEQRQIIVKTAEGSTKTGLWSSNSYLRINSMLQLPALMHGSLSRVVAGPKTVTVR